MATYVAPPGARAASAGTYILLASHIAAMSPATNVGAATPVSMMGEPSDPEDQSRFPRGPDPGPSQDEAKENAEEQPEDGDQKPAPEKADGSAMEKKVINDAVAYIRGLAEQRGRNADWAELAVREADSITSEKALELGVIDFIAENVGDLLEQANGMVVEVNDVERTLDTQGLVIQRIEPDWRNELLGVITSPTIAYILLLVGIYGLIL